MTISKLLNDRKDGMMGWIVILLGTLPVSWGMRIVYGLAKKQRRKKVAHKFVCKVGCNASMGFPRARRITVLTTENSYSSAELIAVGVVEELLENMNLELNGTPNKKWGKGRLLTEKDLFEESQRIAQLFREAHRSENGRAYFVEWLEEGGSL